MKLLVLFVFVLPVPALQKLKRARPGHRLAPRGSSVRPAPPARRPAAWTGRAGRSVAADTALARLGQDSITGYYDGLVIYSVL